ncbi:MAG TPA: protein-glutamate O-methyltransferase CheR [Clostridia bacterium]|nr:protein-glutamate O-methyltransferase CheR [Clostridia bacterium]
MEITQKEFLVFSEYIKANFGINLTSKKKTLVTSRLNNIIEKHGFDNFMDYLHYIEGDASGESVVELLNRITTNHTFFYREKKHFEYLKDIVLPELSISERNERDIRIWSAGCSSGEEPYTTAMILSEFFANEKRLWDTKILATDISTSALIKAKAGIYSKSSLGHLPDIWRMKYFVSHDRDFVRINDQLRKEIIYRRFNLMSNFPYKKKFHVIFCRNVMIYFDTETKAELIDKFYDCLEPGGYLFIGHSESVDRRRSTLKYIKPAIYRKE